MTQLCKSQAQCWPTSRESKLVYKMFQIQSLPEWTLVTSRSRRDSLLRHTENPGQIHSYFAYGLGIHSLLPLPEFMAAPAVGADVVIKLGGVSHSFPDMRHAQSSFHMSATTQEACLSWDRLGTFLVRNGREIIIEPFPGAEERLL